MEPIGRKIGHVKFYRISMWFQAELSFHTGQIIHVYGEMDDDGFFMAEIDGVRGLVPSNFLTEANDQYAGPGQPSQGQSPISNRNLMQMRLQRLQIK